MFDLLKFPIIVATIIAVVVLVLVYVLVPFWIITMGIGGGVGSACGIVIATSNLVRAHKSVYSGARMGFVAYWSPGGPWKGDFTLWVRETFALNHAACAGVWGRCAAQFCAPGYWRKVGGGFWFFALLFIIVGAYVWIPILILALLLLRLVIIAIASLAGIIKGLIKP